MKVAIIFAALAAVFAAGARQRRQQLDACPPWDAQLRGRPLQPVAMRG